MPCRDQCHVRHVVDRELAERLAFDDPLREMPRRHAVRERHAVADEQDDVLRLARAGIVDVPGELAGMGAVGHAELVDAGLRERDVAQKQRRLVLAVLARDEIGGLAENLGMILAVQCHRDLRRIGKAGKLDLQVEPRAGQNVSPVNRINRLRRTGRSGRQNRNANARSKEPAHVLILQNSDDQT
jgi:hypothetical protein